MASGYAPAAELEQDQTPSVDETRRQAEIEAAATLEAAADAATKIVVEAEETAQRLLVEAKRLAELEAKAIVETAEQEAWEVLVSATRSWRTHARRRTRSSPGRQPSSHASAKPRVQAQPC